MHQKIIDCNLDFHNPNAKCNNKNYNLINKMQLRCKWKMTELAKKRKPEKTDGKNSKKKRMKKREKNHRLKGERSKKIQNKRK